MGAPAPAAIAELEKKAQGLLKDLSKSKREAVERCIREGVGFHTGELPSQLRALMEDGFRSGALQTIVATTTLAAGVNLPCSRVIIEGPFRYGREPWEAKVRAVYVDFVRCIVHFPHTSFSRICCCRCCPYCAQEYRQMIGRAGRQGFVKTGEGYLLTDETNEEAARALIRALVPPVASTLLNGCAVRVTEEGVVADTMSRGILDTVILNPGVRKDDIKL